MILIFGLMVVLCIIMFMLYRLLERVEDDLVDIELTYERMRCVITYLRDCIQYSEHLSRQINVHKMKLNSTPFEMIRSGEKTIELRLFDEKRQQVKIGDKIVFTNNANGEILNTTVVKLHRFDSFKELYKSLPLLKCGYTTENVDKATPSDMEQYYSVEEQRKYGVVGIELCLPKNITYGPYDKSNLGR